MIRIRGLGKGIALPAFLFCLLIWTNVSSEGRNGLAAKTPINSAGGSRRLITQASSAQSGNKGRSACDRIELGPLSLPAKNPWPCLVKDIGTEDVVSATPARPGTAKGRGVKITVGQTLKRLKARCRKGRLVDAAGKEIYFYRLQGCWGNPPADYVEILNQQRSELERLRSRYSVIEMTCNPSGEPIQ